MKIKTSDASGTLGMHPSQLLLHIAELHPSFAFAEVWPEIDKAWIETVAAMERKRIPDQPGLPSSLEPLPKVAGPSRNAVHVLDKLIRQDRWGSASVIFEALLHHTRLPKRDLEDAVAELRKAGFLDHDGGHRGTVSLNSGKRAEIERIVQQQVRG